MASDSDSGDIPQSEAGQKGGQRTSDTHGKEFYQEIGHKGGEKRGERAKGSTDKANQAENL